MCDRVMTGITVIKHTNEFSPWTAVNNSGLNRKYQKETVKDLTSQWKALMYLFEQVDKYCYQLEQHDNNKINNGNNNNKTNTLYTVLRLDHIDQTGQEKI